MDAVNVFLPDLSSEFVFQTSRSSGPGGQNVNKVSSRVELRFDVPNSALLDDAQKELLLRRLASKLTSNGVLLVASQEDRSQHRNKEIVVARFYELLQQALKPVKKRRATRPTRASVERRIQLKKKQGEKKTRRGKMDF